MWLHAPVAETRYDYTVYLHTSVFWNCATMSMKHLSKNKKSMLFPSGVPHADLRSGKFSCICVFNTLKFYNMSYKCFSWLTRTLAELKAPPYKCFVLLFHLLASVRVRTDGSHELFAARDSTLHRQIPFKGGGRQTVVTLFLSGLHSSDVNIYITSNKQSNQMCSGYTLNWFSCNFVFECLCVCIFLIVPSQPYHPPRSKSFRQTPLPPLVPLPPRPPRPPWASHKSPQCYSNNRLGDKEHIYKGGAFFES